MLYSRREVTCPVCGANAKVSQTWVLNKYGKRYEYFIYHHSGFNHYSNKNSKRVPNIRKGELQKKLIEEINSERFKLGSFRISDVRNSLVKDFPNAGYGSIKVSLNRLAEIGIIERRKKGRNLYYSNITSKERLSFAIESLSIGLEDIESDNLFKKHSYHIRISNDHSWPMYYFPYQIVGDVDISFNDLRFRAIDLSSLKDINFVLLEDAPKDKRFLLKFPSPLLEQQVRELRIEYFWPEPSHSFVYSTATKMNNFRFSVSGENPVSLSAFLTLGSSNETKDLSSSVIEAASKTRKHTLIFEIENVEPFSVLQFKWK